MSHFYLNIYDEITGSQLPESEWTWSRTENLIGDKFILVESDAGVSLARRVNYLEKENNKQSDRIKSLEEWKERAKNIPPTNRGGTITCTAY